MTDDLGASGLRATPAGMHFRGRNRDGQGDASSSDGGNINVAGAVVDEEALTPAMVVELTSRQQQHDENEEQQELVVQVPTNTSTTSTTQSFALPGITWELSEEAIALRREAIHREVR
jgi:hypothetical protein